ncbi:hypothetical protein FPQ18DRAFT_306525 [Pyronema domesticum]|nr:hypothetical protein FPQ18DRAFT_306525 [Pyronema domesticum]
MVGINKHKHKEHPQQIGSLHTKAFLFGDIAHKARAELIRNTKVGTRFEREEKEKEDAEQAGGRDGGDEREGRDVEEDWDDEEMAEGLRALAAEMDEAEVRELEHRRELAYEEGMAWIRRQFGDGGVFTLDEEDDDDEMIEESTGDV